jgi:DinB superfamily
MGPRRPNPSEFNQRFTRYMELVPEDDILNALTQQLQATMDLVHQIPESLVDYRYAPGKWTTREVIGHVLDTERILGFRLLTFARGDETPLVRADEELYVRHGQFSRYPLNEWMEEYSLSRRSNIELMRHLPAEAWDRTGTVSDLPISVRAIAYFMVGHERHHIQIIRYMYVKQ